MVHSGSTTSRVKQKSVKIGIHGFSARRSAFETNELEEEFLSFIILAVIR